jgi:flagellar motor switch protein FliN
MSPDGPIPDLATHREDFGMSIVPQPENEFDVGAMVGQIDGETIVQTGPPPTIVQPVQFSPLAASGGAAAMAHGIDMLLDVHLSVRVELGGTHMTIRDILGLRAGSVVELDKLAGEPLDVLANGTLIARGEVVVVDEKFGVRLVEIFSKAKRLIAASSAG